MAYTTIRGNAGSDPKLHCAGGDNVAITDISIAASGPN